MSWREKWESWREDREHRAYVLAEEAKHGLAVRVHDLRKARGMSQKALAEAVGTKQPNISAVETGDANVTIETLGKLAAALGVGVAELLQSGEPTVEGGARGAAAATGKVPLTATVYVAEGFSGFGMSQFLVFRSGVKTELHEEDYAESNGRSWS